MQHHPGRKRTSKLDSGRFPSAGVASADETLGDSAPHFSPTPWKASSLDTT